MMSHCRSPIPIALSTAALLVACNDHPIKSVCYEHHAEATTQISRESRRKVDLLFVIDDSGSMGEEQAALAENFGVLVEQLEQLEVDADYRIGITTTESGNAHCGGKEQEVGVLRLRSCWTHLDDFVFLGIDRRDEACRRSCPSELAELRALPSALEEGGALAPRPWLERGRGGTNVPAAVDVAQALACWGPQGISGCGFESPLEAMLAALDRSDDPGDAGAGFVRDDALLQVVLITDEADCSIAPGGEAAFDPEGARALWPDPSERQAPSAVCWNAGVACRSEPDGRTRCDPADVDLAGQPAEAEDAVLHPLFRYIDRLEQLDARKRQRLGVDEPQVLLSVIAGVPTGYDGQPLDYGPGDDPDFVDDFGVGPGCRSDKGMAVPPVRLLAVADALGDDAGPNVFSICDGDYRPALRAIADRLIDRLSRPTCIDGAAAGLEELAEGLPSHCVVEQRIGSRRRSVPACERPREGGGWALPAGASLCAYTVTDDTVHPRCAAGDDPAVELRYLQAPDAEFGEVEVTCALEPGLGCGG